MVHVARLADNRQTSHVTEESSEGDDTFVKEMEGYEWR